MSCDDTDKYSIDIQMIGTASHNWILTPLEIAGIIHN